MIFIHAFATVLHTDCWSCVNRRRRKAVRAEVLGRVRGNSGGVGVERGLEGKSFVVSSGEEVLGNKGAD